MNGVWILALLLTSGGQSPVTSNPPVLVRQLGTFPDALPAGSSSYGRLSEIEERRSAVYHELRVLDAAADPALTRGLANTDVRVRRGVALYLVSAGGNYSNIAPRALDLTRFLDPLVQALHDPDQRVKELSAQAIGLIGPAAAVAVSDLVRLLADPAEGLRNTACIGLAGIGPAAREALPALRDAVTDSRPDVRRSAQFAIDKIERREHD